MMNHKGLAVTFFGRAQERLDRARNLPWSSIGAVIAPLVLVAGTIVATVPGLVPVELE